MLGLVLEAGPAMLTYGGSSWGQEESQGPSTVPVLVRKCGSVLAPSVTGFRPVVPPRLPGDV